MAAKGGTNHGFKKARGALKIVKFTKPHGNYHKALDYAIHKATNQVQALPKEKHVRTIFHALSNRNEAAYCMYRLARRLAETYYWTDALKTLLILHRAMRELSNTFCEDLANYSQREGYIFDVSHLKDGFSPSGECCAWVRKYALYLEERLRCFDVLNHDVVKHGPKTRNPDTRDLFEHLPAQQQLLHQLLLCKPVGAASYNSLIHIVLSIVASESVKIYVAITSGVVNLIDKFFEMNRDDALWVLEIYQKSGSQAEELSGFFDFCKSLEFGRGQKFINIKQPPASFITTMEDYIKEAPTTLMIEDKETQITDEHGPSPKQNSAPVGGFLTEHEQDIDVKENPDASLEKTEAVAAPQFADLLGLDDLLTEAFEFEKSSLALTVVPTENSLTAGSDDDFASQTAGWELALFSDPTSNESLVPEGEVVQMTEPFSSGAVAEQSQVASRLDELALDNLYNGAIETTQPQANGAYQWEPVFSNPFEDTHGSTAPPTSQGIFYFLPDMAPPPMQTADMSHQQNFTVQQHQQQFMMNRKSTNPFDEPFTFADPTQSSTPSDPTQSSTPSDPSQSNTLQYSQEWLQLERA
ncbi:hypothetical protein L6164_014138 [Bauhinia variegata]|uniref:Uncharacterized protein n=1 Tax=Bauhinia variegata TaxID=167791 RepID=A0ACB9NGL0_BAUVA|nr:hypothetical protein L6164_014138 [Bauhinia variegata]